MQRWQTRSVPLPGGSTTVAPRRRPNEASSASPGLSHEDSVRADELEKLYWTLHRRISRGAATIDDVRRALSQSSSSPGWHVVNTINLVKATINLGDDDEVVALLRDVWERRRSAHPTLAWQDLTRPSVQVALAGTLAALGDDRTAAFRDLIVETLDSSDEVARFEAALALGLVANEEDIRTLAALATGDDLSMAIAAAYSLGNLEPDRASAVIGELLDNPMIDPEVREALETVQQDFDRF